MYYKLKYFPIILKNSLHENKHTPLSSHSTSTGALNGAAKISAGSFYSKPSSMGGSAERQKRAIEEKRLAALARKQYHIFYASLNVYIL